MRGLFLFASTFVFLMAVSQVHDAAAQGLEVSKRDCERLNKRNASVSADYQAGVDVRGNAVEGADLDGGSPIKLPDEITIPIGIDIAEKYGLDADGVSTGDVAIGTVKVKGSQVYYNGKRLGGSEESAIKAACQQTYGQ